MRWEAATQPAVDAGVRTVMLRTSPVLDRSGGPFLPMRLAWSLGLGATLGDGSQRMPMISLDDYLGVVQWSATNAHVAGAYNLTIPEPATNAEFTDALAAQLHRPRFLKAPALVIKTALGELAGQLIGDVWVRARAAAGRRLPLLLSRRRSHHPGSPVPHVDSGHESRVPLSRAGQRADRLPGQAWDQQRSIHAEVVDR